MSRELPKPGTYAAHLIDKIRVYPADSGALCAALPVQLLSSDVAWQGKHTMTLAKSDGTIQRKTVEVLKRVFNWDGMDFAYLMETDLTSIEFEVVGDHEKYTPPGEGQEERTVFKIVFINPPGGGMTMPEAMDVKEIHAKWGSKFKALFGGSAPAKAAAPAAKTQAAPAKAAATPAPAAKPKSSGPPSRKVGSATSASARTATADEVWTAYKTAHPDESDDVLGEQFYAAQDELFPGSEGQLDPQQWGKVADKLGV